MKSKIIAGLMYLCCFTALSKPNYIQFNVTPHSSEVIFSQPLNIDFIDNAVSHIRLDSSHNDFEMMIKTLATKGVVISLPENTTMVSSRQMPVIYSPKWELDYGKYMLSIPGVSIYPIAVDAKHGYSIFNLANLLLTRKIERPLSEFFFVIGWWDNQRDLIDFPVKLLRVEQNDKFQDYRLEPLCDIDLPLKEAITLFNNANQQDVRELAVRQNCIN